MVKNKQLSLIKELYDQGKYSLAFEEAYRIDKGFIVSISNRYSTCQISVKQFLERHQKWNSFSGKKLRVADESSIHRLLDKIINETNGDNELFPKSFVEYEYPFLIYYIDQAELNDFKKILKIHQEKNIGSILFGQIKILQEQLK